jgi:hypothetical protein
MCVVRQIVPYPLWVGHAGDARDTGALLATGLLAVVDLALAEPPVPVTRELAYCRFPMVDGPGNPPWRSLEECLALAIAGGARDVSPGFWRELVACLARVDVLGAQTETNQGRAADRAHD